MIGLLNFDKQNMHNYCYGDNNINMTITNKKEHWEEKFLKPIPM